MPDGLGKLRGVEWIICTVLTCSACGCLTPQNPGVVYTESNNSNIRNGIVTESAELIDFPLGAKLVLPAGTKVESAAETSYPRIVIDKELAVFGHPTEVISIDELRHRMGIAVQLDPKANSYVVATYGEYAIDGHGGARISLTARVPAGVQVEFRENLSGPNNLAMEGHTIGAVKAGWTRLTAQPFVGK